MAKKVSIKDIAKELNISIDAVSKALRDSPQISEKTKKAVREKAAELGYVKNSLALNLKTGTSTNIVICLNNLYNPYFSMMHAELAKKIEDYGFSSSLSFTRKYTLQYGDVVKALGNQPCAVISLVEPEKDVVLLLERYNIPLYLVGIKPKEEYESINYAITDDFDGGYQVGCYFKNNRFNRALFITDSPSETVSRRYNGFLKALKNCDKFHTNLGYNNDESLMDKAFDIIKKENIDFVFCFSDFIAYQLKNKLNKEKYTNEIQIFGYDNISEHVGIFEPICSVGSDIDLISKEVVKSTIQTVDGGGSGSFKKVYPVKLIIK